MSTTLPLEMISDVLSRLPVKSLLRFRSTSKPFRSTIDGPNFTKLHLNRSAHQSLVLTSRKLHSIDLPSLERAVEIEHPLKTVRESTVVIGSCNGLLCLCNAGAETLELWNKFTGKHHRLPYSAVDTTGLHYVAHGFGHDPVHDDYKVMRIVRSGRSDSQVLIYSLRSNSWRSLGAFPYPLPPYGSMGVFGDGAIHWYINLPEGMATAAFDLATELYRVVPQPPVDRAGGYFVQMTAFEGRLCAVCNYVGKPTEMWVLDRDQWRWAKLVSILDPLVAASTRRVLPMAYVRDGNELVLLQDDDKFLCYDLGTQKVKDVVIQGMPDSVDGFSVDAVPCVESLVDPSPMAVMQMWESTRAPEARRRGMISCPKDSSWFYEQCWKRKGRSRALG